MKPPKLRHAIPSLLLLFPAGAATEIVERVVAKVNGDILTLSEFENRQVAAVQAARITPERVEGFLREQNARILQDAIDDILLVQRAAEVGIRLRPDYVKEVIDGIKKENNLPSDEALTEQLRHEGMSMGDLKRQIERSILRRQLLAREVEPKAAVSDPEVRADYEARLAEYTRPASVHLQEILVAAGDAAVVRAGELVARAREGEDFGDLARAESAAPTRAAGGDLGVLHRGELAPSLEAVAFGLAPGGVSNPIPVADGLRILRAVERSDASVVPFDEVKEAIREKLGQTRFAQEITKLIESLRKSAVIDLRVREVPLQVSLPAVSTPLLESPTDMPAATSPASPVPPRAPEAEIETSPQAAPAHVVPTERKKDEPPPPPPPR
jgi:parvulin-like peptidyl-prolyl isomerase